MSKAPSRNDKILIVDDDGRIKEYNAALLNILKMQAGDVITGMDVLELIAKEDRKEISQLIAMLRLDGPAGASDVSVAQRINSHIYDVNGALCPVELSCAIDHSFDGRFSYIVFIRDRSQEVAAANVLRDARDRARMDAKAKERFLSVLSHEMRTPLHGVITSLELVQLGEVDQARQVMAVIDSDPRLATDAAMAPARSALELAGTRVDDGELVALRAAAAADPANMGAQFAYAEAAFAAGERDAAADTLLAMVAADREWNEGAARAKLLAVRNRRVWPARDEKILTAWNGMMIGNNYIDS